MIRKAPVEKILFDKEVATKVQGRYKTRIYNADGSLEREQQDWKPNLILNCGLEKIAYMPWANVSQFAVAGIGTTPTKVDTSSNASQSGVTVSINSGVYTFDSNTIVGKLIYWPGTDSYAEVIAYVSPSTVTVDTSATVVNGLFSVYNVDQTALAIPYSMHCRYVPGAGFCGTTIENNTVRLLRTYDFYLENTPVLITEVGFKESPEVEELFSRVVLQEPQYLAAGQYFQISYELAVTLEPGTATSRTVDVSGWPISPSVTVSGVEQIQSLGMAVIDLSGVTQPYDRSFLCNEAYTPGTIYLGPEFGYVNRWQNGNGTPVKQYGALSANPFAYHRNYVDFFEDSPTGSYFPRVSAAALNGNSYTGSFAALIDTDIDLGNWPQQLLALSAEYPTVIITPPVQWGKLNPTASLSATVWSAALSAYLSTTATAVSSTYSFSPTLWSYVLTQSWPLKVITKPDGTHVVIDAKTNTATYETGVTTASPIPAVSTIPASAWNLQPNEEFDATVTTWLMPPYDPVVEFPAIVHQAEFNWTNWTHTFSPSASGLPVAGSSVFISTASAAPVTFNTCVDRSSVNVEIPLTIVPYASGSCERIKKATFLTNMANGTTWRTIGIGPTDTNLDVGLRTSAAKYNGYVYVFNEPQTKYDTHILNVFFKYTWRRDLST